MPKNAFNQNYTYTCDKCGNPILDCEPVFMSREEFQKNAVKGFYHRLCLPASTTEQGGIL
jgi:hypothetical protein